MQGGEDGDVSSHYLEGGRDSVLSILSSAGEISQNYLLLLY